MISSKDYARTYLVATGEFDPKEVLAWAIVLRDHRWQRKIFNLASNDLTNKQNDLIKLLKLPKPIANFIKIIIEDKQQNRLDRIIEQIFIQAYKQKKGAIVNIEVPQALTVEQLNNLNYNLEKQLKMPVLLSEKIKTTLIGGAKIKVTSQEIDLSYKNQLLQLKHNLTA